MWKLNQIKQNKMSNQIKVETVNDQSVSPLEAMPSARCLIKVENVNDESIETIPSARCSEKTSVMTEFRQTNRRNQSNRIVPFLNTEKIAEQVGKANNDVYIDHLKESQSMDGLNFFEQVMRSDRITHSVYTPYDTSTYVQLLLSPFNKAQYITVQKVNKKLQVFQDDATNQHGDFDESKCPNQHRFMKLSENEVHKQCSICIKDAYWVCSDDQCELNLFCAECRARRFSRWKLTKKTQMHQSYTQFDLKIDDKKCKFQQVEQQSETLNCPIAFVAVWEKVIQDDHNSDFVPVRQFQIENPVYLNTKTKNDRQNKLMLNFPQLLYFDRKSENLCFYTFEPVSDTLKLHSIEKQDLDSDSSEKDSKFLEDSNPFEFNGQLKNLVKQTLGLQSSPSNSLKPLQQFPEFVDNQLIVVRGVSPKHKCDKMDEDQKKYMSDLHIFQKEDQRRTIIEIHNIGLAIHVRIDKSMIIVYSIQEELNSENFVFVVNEFTACSDGNVQPEQESLFRLKQFQTRGWRHTSEKFYQFVEPHPQQFRRIARRETVRIQQFDGSKSMKDQLKDRHYYQDKIKDLIYSLRDVKSQSFGFFNSEAVPTINATYRQSQAEAPRDQMTDNFYFNIGQSCVCFSFDGDQITSIDHKISWVRPNFRNKNQMIGRVGIPYVTTRLGRTKLSDSSQFGIYDLQSKMCSGYSFRTIRNSQTYFDGDNQKNYASKIEIVGCEPSGQTTDSGKQIHNIAVIYKPLDGQLKICFTTALQEYSCQMEEKEGEVKKVKKHEIDKTFLHDAKLQELSQEIHYVNYPHLAYISYEPKRNIMMVANIEENIPQLKFNITPYKFICFAETGIRGCKHPWSDFYFLASWKNTFYLLRLYQKQRLPCTKKNFDIMVMKGWPQSSIIAPGSIQQCFLVRTETADFMTLKHSDDINSMVIYEIGSSSYSRNVRQSLTEEEEILSLKAVCGPYNDIYFVSKKDDDDFNINCISFTGCLQRRYKVEQVFQNQYEIRSIQLSIHSQLNQKEYAVQLFILDSKHRYHTLRKEKQQTMLKLTPLKPSVKLTNQIKVFQTKMKEMESDECEIPYELCIFNKRNFSVCYPNNSRKMGLNLNVNSDSFYEHEFLDFFVDNIKNKEDVETVELEAISFEQIPWIRKSLARIRENQGSYFLTQKSASTNNVDMFNIEQQHNRKLYYRILESKIYVSNQVQYLNQNLNFCQMFDRQSMLLEKQYDQFKRIRCFYSYDSGWQCAVMWIKSKSKLESKTKRKSSKTKPSDPDLIIHRYDSNGKCIESESNNGSNFHSLNEDRLSDIVLTNQGSLVNFKLQNNSQITDGHLKLQVEKNEECPGIDQQVSIQINKAIDKQYQINVLLAQDYLIIRFNLHDVYYCSNKKLLTELANFTGQTRSEAPSECQMQKSEVIEESFRVFEILKFWSKDILECGVRIDYNNYASEQKSFEETEEGNLKNRNNIQFTSTDHMLTWNLDLDQEMNTLFNYYGLTNVDTYSKTGYLLYTTNMEDEQDFCRNWSFESRRFTYSKGKTLINMPRHGNELACCFKPYNEYDIQQIISLQENGVLRDTIIDLRSIVADIHGRCMIHAFLSKKDVLDKILQNIQMQGFESHLDEKEQIQDHPFIRQLIRNLALPVMANSLDKDLSHASGFDPQDAQPVQISTYSPMKAILCKRLKPPSNEEDPTETLLQLSRMAHGANLEDLVRTFESFKAIIQKNSSAFNQFMSECHFTTSMSESVTKLQWQEGVRQIILVSNTSILSEEEIRSKIKSKQQKNPKQLSYIFVCCQKAGERIERFKAWFFSLLSQRIERQLPVEVKIYSLTFLKTRQDFEKLYKFMAEEANLKVFQIPIVESLLIEQNYTRQIGWVLLIYCCKIIFVTFYFYNFLANADHLFWKYVFMSGTLIFTLQELVHEFKQFKASDKYVSTINAIQMLNHVFIFSIVVTDLSNMDEYTDKTKENLIVLASISSFMMPVQLILYWLALFEQTSFFVKMVTESFQDVKWFLLMVFLCIGSFANGIAVLTKPASDEGEPIVDVKFDNVILDSLLTEYLLGLGEFETDDYNENEFHKLLWIYFLLSTFLTQIIFVNTLIAILGSTYGRIMEQRATYALMERTIIYNDFMHLIKPIKELKENKFMYVIKPVDVEENENEKSFDLVRQEIEKSQSTQQDFNQKQQDAILRMQAENQDLKDRIVTLQKTQDEKLGNVMAIQTEMMNNIRYIAKSYKQEKQKPVI